MSSIIREISSQDIPAILYIDDEPELLTLGKIFLEKEKTLSVDTISSAVCAMEKITLFRYDAIVSDYQMPGMSGIDLLKKIRSTFGDIPFILFTGRGREDVVIEALNNGADFYLQKGYDISSQFTELQHIIHRAIDQRRAKAALNKSIDQLSHAEKVAGLGHWTFHMDSRKVSASQGARAIYGFEEDQELTISFVQQTALPQFRQYLDEALKKLIEEGKPYDVKFKIFRRIDGKIIDIHSIAEYDPATSRVFGTIQNITRLKEVESELRRKNEELQAAYEKIRASEEDLRSYIKRLTIQGQQISEREYRLRLLSDNLPNGLVYQVIVNPDGTRHFEYISAGVHRIHNITTDDVLRDSSMLYNQVMKEDIPLLKEAEQQALKTRTDFTAEVRIRTPGGVIRWILLRSIPRELSDGSILWDGFEIDITETKTTENALKENNELFSQLIRHSPIYIYIKVVTATESRVLYASENYLDMINISGSDMVGKTMFDLFPQELAEKITADDREVVTRGQVLKLHENLNERNYISIKFPIVQQDRTLLAGYTIDITDLKQIEESLHEANQKLRLLTGLTRHDIFNQITVVQEILDLISITTDPDEIIDFITSARRSCNQIISTIGFTREYEDFGIVYSTWQCIHSIIESAKNEINPENIKIENIIPKNVEIYADPIIKKVFTTLLENAARHGEKVTIIRFSCIQQEKMLSILCEDNGIGIREHDKKKIFEHGYGKHTGIGLFLAKEILSITGLSIIENGESGIGARFEIIVPEGKFNVSDPQEDAIIESVITKK